ncbi:MAG: hypothetical protein JO205_06390 [Pseudolabrys sp.]|nr:hypothetical protein [Pseudolabrys sp.]
MCQACFEADAMYRHYLLENPADRGKLTDGEAAYFGFKRDAAGHWVDAWTEAAPDFRAEQVEPAAQ